MSTNVIRVATGLWGTLFAAVALAGPTLEIPDPVFEFGKMERGKSVSHNFVIKNTGDAPLLITRVRSACGCTRTQVKQKEVAPGAQTELEVRLSLRLQKGAQNRSIQIETNDPEHPTAKVTMAGFATSRVTLMPEALRLKTTSSDVGVAGDIEVKAIEGLKFNIKDIQTSGPNVVATVTPITPGEAYKIHVKLEPPLEEGLMKGWVHLLTDQKGEYSMIGIAVSAVVPGDLTILPRKLEFMANRKGAFGTTVIIGPGKVKDFVVTSVESPLESVSTTFRKRGNGYQVVLRNIEVSSQLQGTAVKIHTNVEGGKTYAIPIELRSPKGKKHAPPAHGAPPRHSPPPAAPK